MQKDISPNAVPFAPLIFRKILKDRFNGSLTISSHSYKKTFFFKDGALGFATTNVPGERLGEILCRCGKIHRSQLYSVLKADKVSPTREKIGKLLVRKQLLHQRDIYQGLMTQIKTIAISTFSLATGEWQLATEYKNSECQDKIMFNIELPAIIVVGIKRNRLNPYFKDTFSFQRIKVKKEALPEEIKVVLDKEDIWFYDWLSMLDNTIANEILSRLDLTEEFFWKKIMLFYLMDFIDFEDNTVGDGDGSYMENIKSTAEIEEMFQRIKVNSSGNYYELMGLNPSAAKKEIKDRYLELARRFHPDRVEDTAENAMKEKANAIFAEINRGFEILSDEEKKLEYDLALLKRNRKVRVQVPGKDEKPGKSPFTIYRSAQSLYKDKKYFEAIDLLKGLMDPQNPTPKYLFLLGLCQMNLPTLKQEAQKSLQKVCELEPWNPEPYATLGNMFLAEGMVQRAKTCFSKALEIEPQHWISRYHLDRLQKKTIPRSTFRSLLDSFKEMQK